MPYLTRFYSFASPYQQNIYRWKKFALTDAIFEHLAQVQQQAENDPTILRLALDANAHVKLGPFSRGGKTRIETVACDHAFKPTATLTPYGIFLPNLDELVLFFTASTITSDFIVDGLEAWWQTHRDRFAQVKTLRLKQDNGPEVTTQF